MDNQNIFRTVREIIEWRVSYEDLFYHLIDGFPDSFLSIIMDNIRRSELAYIESKVDFFESDYPEAEESDLQVETFIKHSIVGQLFALFGYMELLPNAPPKCLEAISAYHFLPFFPWSKDPLRFHAMFGAAIYGAYRAICERNPDVLPRLTRESQRMGRMVALRLNSEFDLGIPVDPIGNED